MMRINNYDFGRIVIDKKEYNRDLIVSADKVIYRIGGEKKAIA